MTKPATRRVLHLLVCEGGINPVPLDIPAEVAEHPMGAPLITHDDVIDFHEELAALEVIPPESLRRVRSEQG